MSLGAGPAGGPREILVWSVKCLRDGTIVSGDSTGELRFWDGNNFTLVQRLKSHVADILDVAVSADGESVISAGVDRRTTIYKRIGSGKKGDRRRWAESSHKRFHSHDVKVMATFETKSLSVVASGGLDTTPIIIPFREFGKENSRTLSSLPQSPQVQSAPAERLMMSWWDREVNLWRIYGSPHTSHDGDGFVHAASKRTRKLVARVVLKGDENITSSCLSGDGSLLAVSTISDIKLFRFKQRKTEGTDALRVSKIDTPSALQGGAKLVSFSPDANWLVIIDTDNTVRAIRIMQDQASKNGVRMLARVIDLKRIHRERGKQSLQHGSLGNYERTIIRVAFSDDSRILVVGDLSGYLDSWVLEGHEDLTQDADTEVQDERSSASSDDESSGEEEEEEEERNVILGQHWIRNPAAKLLPRLPAAPLVLSFRPSVSTSNTRIVNGYTAVHPTRHNPHPHSHNLPSGEDRLFAITCEHHIYEFAILKGSLSEWSRRNPTQLLPADFREVRDRAMGCVWDVSHERQRLWIYGSGWLWMFDLARDFPPSDKRDEASRRSDGASASMNHRKRKMENREIDGEDLRKHDSGAGGKVRESEISTGIGRKMRKTIGPESTESKWTSLDAPSSPDSEEDEDGASTWPALTGLRRYTNESKADARNGDDAHVPEDNAAMAVGKTDEAPRWWSTYKYRPILGIVPIGTADEADGKDMQSQDLDDGPVGIEVAIVERPMWDVDLPPRYYGDQEWDK